MRAASPPSAGAGVGGAPDGAVRGSAGLGEAAGEAWPELALRAAGTEESEFGVLVLARDVDSQGQPTRREPRCLALALGAAHTGRLTRSHRDY
jgi:hypothetical protein